MMYNNSHMRILLITPPMTQVNSPYPATPYLTTHLRSFGYTTDQRDLGLDLFHKIFSKAGLKRVGEVIRKKKSYTDVEDFFISAFDDYSQTISSVIRFLQGKDPTLALRLARRQLVPEGPRFLTLSEHPEILDRFGEMGLQDQAKYIASLYLDDLSDIIRTGVDPRFEFSRYGEQLASSEASFEPLVKALQKKSLIDVMIEECVDEYISEVNPDVVGLTIPFPGNVFGALRAAQCFKEKNKKIVTVAGGGFVNTELRELSDIRFFDYIDYLVFDDGELPFQRLIENLNGEKKELVRTWKRQKNKIIKSENTTENVPFKKITGPTYVGLKLDQYVSMLEMPNPMHRMWSDFRWNKMILAHGCYWKKCTFCDIHLDYINRFEPARVENLIEIIERIIGETGQTGFHFVDEAAPPALLKSLSEELIKRKIKITWWGNLRFDKQFTPDVAKLMSDAGCVAVTGGLEVASPRILKLINKGTTLEQVAQVTKAFADAGVYVHAYLMYGFPSQTKQETIDSLEVVRQLFAQGCLHSAHWHRFVTTAHSPVGREPEKFGIQLQQQSEPLTGLFAKNSVPFTDSVKCNHDKLGQSLRKAVYNYMHGIGINENVQFWFEEKIKTGIKNNFVTDQINNK
jgi:radical SAM superfamily enzyme YgiQ (UPF0313 family)